VDELKIITDLLVEPPPADEVVARARARLAVLAGQTHEGRGPVTTALAVPAASARPGRCRSRRVLVAAVAAAVLVAGGAGYGLSAVAGGTHRAAAVVRLTAVTGCPQLKAAQGTLERAHGTSLILKTSPGQLVTVTTSASTAVRRKVTEPLSAIADGEHVLVLGPASGHAITAHKVTIGSVVSARLGRLLARPNQSPAPGGLVYGTVTSAGAGGFTMAGPGGRHVRVTTSDVTKVITMASASVSQLQSGRYVIAVGSAGPDGTLAAATVEQTGSLPGPALIPFLRPPWGGCSPSGVALAALLSAS
jgi:hypothetical protein